MDAEANDFESSEFRRRTAARKIFTLAHSEWTAALAEIAALNASPDSDDEERFNTVVERAYDKRRTAIDAILAAPALTQTHLLQKFAVIEDVALDQAHTLPGTDNPLSALLASLKADLLRIDLS